MVVWEGVTAVRVVLVLVLTIVVSIKVFVLLRLEDEALCFTVLLVDAEFEVLDTEDLGPTELVDLTGDPLIEDEEERRVV